MRVRKLKISKQKEKEKIEKMEKESLGVSDQEWKELKTPLEVSDPSSLEFGTADGIIASKKMNELLHELRYHVYKSGELIIKIYNQGIADGRSNKQIRKLIDEALRGILGDRQIRRLVPQELKQLQYHPEHDHHDKRRIKKADILSTFQPEVEKSPAYFAKKYDNLINAFSAEREAYEREQTRKQEQENKEFEEAYKRGEIKIRALSLEEMERLKRNEQSTPLELYIQGLKAAEKLWTALTNKDRLIASDRVDALVEHIKPTRDFRLRIFKGLDNARVNHYIRCIMWLDMLMQDTLRMYQEYSKEGNKEIDK